MNSISRIAVMGCGALGSLITTMLSCDGRSFLFWDDDRIEEDNMGTSSFLIENIGAYKARVLANYVYRKSHAVSRTETRTFTGDRVGTLLGGGYDLILDCFDNSEARNLLHGIKGVNILHIGVNEDLIGNVEWDELWHPLVAVPRGENPVCTHHLGYKILLSTAFHAVQCVEAFIERDLKINRIVGQNGQLLASYN